MKCLLFVILFAITAQGQNLVILDSVSVPIIETYDTACVCYPDSMIVYSWLNADGIEADTLAAQFGFSHFGVRVWTTTIMAIDDGIGWSLRPMVMHHLDPVDVNRDGRFSVADVGIVLWAWIEQR